MKKSILFILILLITVASTAQDSQKIKELKEQREKAIAEALIVSELLDNNKKTTATALNRLNLLVKQINTRKEIIRLLNQEIEAVDAGLRSTEINIQKAEKELRLKKETYAKSLRKMYINKNNQNELLYIFSADNITQSYRRMSYLKEYAKWDRRQAEEIINKQKKLVEEKETLIKIKEEKTGLLANRQQEEKKLQGEEDSQQKEVQSLRTQQRQLESELRKKQKQDKALDKAIKKAITEEIARAEKEKVSSKGAEERVAETKGGYAMTKEERRLSGDFVNNKGLLPFPIKGNYTVISGFGTYKPEGLKYVSMKSNGINIQTTPGNTARAVFNGRVSTVFTFAGFNSSVIVRHGNYLTLYSNLTNVIVKQGDEITIGQVLGKIFTDTEKGNETILHFEVWKETDKLNPEEWLNSDMRMEN